MRPRSFLVLAGVALLAWPGWAGDRVVVVSPGSPEGTLIGDPCPTFSWGSIERAHSYELVLYRLGAEEEQPVLRQSFAGAVASWTPSLDRCLERGGRYAWSVRAIAGKRATPWAELAFFEVALERTGAELRQAPPPVERYLGDSEAGARAGRAPAEGFVDAPRVGGESRLRELSVPSRSSVYLETGQLNVEGTIVADRLVESCGQYRWYLGPCYRLGGIFPGKSWAWMQEYCVSVGYGNLATLTSSAEQAFVLSLWEQWMPEALQSGIWIGYSDARHEGSWEWSTGELGVTGNNSTYANWAPGEPNDWGGAEDCAMMVAGGKWNDADCSTGLNYFVCERDH